MNTIPTTTQQEFEKFLIIQRVAQKTKEAYLRAVREISLYHDPGSRTIGKPGLLTILHTWSQTLIRSFSYPLPYPGGRPFFRWQTLESQQR